MANAPDKRVQKTLQALREALLALIVERGYEKTSVQNILDRAQVGRATFYTHYLSKEDLLRKSLDTLQGHLLQEWKRSSKTSEDPLGFSQAFFRHVDSHRRIYRAVVGKESGVIVDRQMRRVLVQLVHAGLPGPRNEPLSDMAAQFVVGALMSIVTWWLDHNIKLSADDIDRLFVRMARPALKAIQDS